MSKNINFSAVKICKCCKYLWNTNNMKQGLCPKCYDYFKQLKQQLVEKDKRIAELENENGYILFEDGYDENGKEVHRQVYTTYQQAFNELVLESKKLRQQLKEKDKEIAHLKHFIGCKGCLDVIKKSNDNQTQLAIQELAEVERLLYESHYKEIDNRYYAELEDIENVIDSRIKALEELKGEKDDG